MVEVLIGGIDSFEKLQTFFYPCPCGDKFEITLEELCMGEDIAPCPSCSLLIRVIYDEEFLMQFQTEV